MLVNGLLESRMPYLGVVYPKVVCADQVLRYARKGIFKGNTLGNGALGIKLL